jgi:hypothetical protein
MLPGMKHRIKICPANRSGQTIVRPTRFGSVIKASSGTSIRTYPEGSKLVAGGQLSNVTKMFNGSNEGRLFKVIRGHALEERKQAALYQDDWLTSVADDFAAEHVNSIFKIAHEARDAIADQFIRRVGRAFYEITLAGG